MSLQAFNNKPVGDAAFLSDAAWDGSGGLKAYLSGTGAKVLPDHKGWTLLEKDKLTNLPGLAGDGYYLNSNVVAFAAMKGDTLAVAIRGIAGPADVQGVESAMLRPYGYYGNVLPL